MLFTKLDSLADQSAATATRLDTHDTQLNVLDVRSTHTAGELEKLAEEVKARDAALNRALSRYGELEAKFDGLAAQLKRPNRVQLDQSAELATLKRSVTSILDKLEESTNKRLRRSSQVVIEEIDDSDSPELASSAGGEMGAASRPEVEAESPVVGAPVGEEAGESRASQRTTGRRQRSAR